MEFKVICLHICDHILTLESAFCQGQNEFVLFLLLHTCSWRWIRIKFGGRDQVDVSKMNRAAPSSIGQRRSGNVWSLNCSQSCFCVWRTNSLAVNEPHVRGLQSTWGALWSLLWILKCVRFSVKRMLSWCECAQCHFRSRTSLCRHTSVWTKLDCLISKNFKRCHFLVSDRPNAARPQLCFSSEVHD